MASNEGSVLARVPWGVVFVTVLLIVMGAINLASASKATRANIYLLQLGWACAGFLMAAVVVRVQTRVLELIAYPAYIAVNLLLVLVLVAGTTKKGATRWLDLGFFNLQPSELAKITIILAVARYFGRYEVPEGYTLRMLLRPLNLSRPLLALGVLGLRWFKQGQKHEAALARGLPVEELPSLDPMWLKATLITLVIGWAFLAVFVLLREGMHHRRIIAPIDIVVIPFGLVLIEPDLGTSLIIIAIAGVMILFCGLRRGSLIIAFTAAASIATTVLLDDSARLVHRHEGWDPDLHRLLETHVRRLVRV